MEREMIIMIKTKTDLGSDEFKVIREISLAHPRLQKKRKISQTVCVIAAFIEGLFALVTFLDRFIEYTLVLLALSLIHI